MTVRLSHERPVSQDELSAIISERFIFGDEAPEGLIPSARVLAEEYGVSRAFLREVLAGLQRQGLVEAIPGRGVFVKKPDMISAASSVHRTLRLSAATPLDLIEARSNLEVETARLAALRATEEDILELETALKAFDDATELLARAKADIAFHAMLARATRNPVLQVMFGSISTLTFELMLRSLADPDVVAAGAPLHHTILKAIKKRDPQKAMKAMGQHLHLAEDTFGDDTHRSLAEVAERVVREVLGSTLPIDAVVDSALQDYSTDITK